MKNLSLLLMVLVLVAFGSCKKENVKQPEAATFAKTIAGTYIAKDGDITFKALPAGAKRTWTMLAINGTNTFYPTPAGFTLVDGREFITNSAAYNFWHNSANNPVNFGPTESVYSNLTPVEDLRIISELKDASDKVICLGMLDFKPDQASFPLTVNTFRLGDVLQINTDAITHLPGGSNLTITATYNLAPVDLVATKVGPLTGTGGVPNGHQFRWEDIIYGPEVSHTVTVGAGDVVLYEGLDQKAMGSVTITISETGNGGSVITKTVPTQGAGKGMMMLLSTNRIGWYDSGTISFSDKDIDVKIIDVPVN
jgi:hypothetical protein